MIDFKFPICLHFNRVELPLGDMVFCEKKMGRKLPYPILDFKDGDICVATRFNLNLHGHVIGGSKVDFLKMYNCPNKETYHNK